MQCLYCNKRLGLFASKKRPFCSELHEVAYQDEQAGVAMRRVMDPLFTLPVKAAPLRMGPGEQSAHPAEDSSETEPLPAPDPEQCSFLEQGLPPPVPPDLASLDAPSRAAQFVPLEVEPSSAGLVQFPSSGGGVLALDFDFTTQDFTTQDFAAQDFAAQDSAAQDFASQDSVTEPISEPPAEIVEESDERIPSGLHPRLEQSKPAAVAQTGAPEPAAGIDPWPLSFGPSAVLAGPSMNASLVASLDIPGPGIEADLAPLVSLPGVRPLLLDPRPRQHGGIPLAAEDEPGPDSDLYPQLPLRYPLANIGIARGMLETPEELSSSRWNAVRLAQPERLARLSRFVPPEDEPWRSGAAPEVAFQVSRGAVATPAAQTRWELPFAAAKALRIAPVEYQRNTQTGELQGPQSPPMLPSISWTHAFRIPFAGTATAAMIAPAPGFRARPRQVTSTGEFHGLPSSPVFPTISSTNAFRIPFAGATAAMTLSAPGSCAWLRQDISTGEFYGPQASFVFPSISSTNAFRIPFAGATAAMPPSAPASRAWPLQDTSTGEFRGSQSPPVLPSISWTNAFRIRFTGTLTATMTPSAPDSRARLQQDTPTGEFCGSQTPPALPAFSSTNAFRIRFTGTLTAAMTPPAPGSPARLQQDTPTGEFRGSQTPVLPAFCSTNAFRIPFAGTATGVRTLSALISSPLPLPEPTSSVLAVQAPISDGGPLHLALSQATASLELRRAGLAARRLPPEPRELSRRSRSARNGVVGMRFLKSRTRPLRRSEPLGIWGFSAEPGEIHRMWVVLASPLEIRSVEHRVQTPATAPQAARRMPPGILARITPAIVEDRRKRVRALGVNDFQRFRAVAHIQIREPGLRNSNPGDLPVHSTNLPWLGVRMGSGIRPEAMPVPLRPSLQTPSPR